jgi:hypothetical protein
MDFIRHVVTKKDVENRKFFLVGEEKKIAEREFKDFFGRKFNLFINDVSWGRGRFTSMDDMVIFELSKSFFRNVEEGSTIELEIVDGITIELRSAPPVDGYIERLSGKDMDDVIDAIRSLGGCRNEKGIPHLISMLLHKNHQVRVAAVRALGRFEPREDIEPELIKMLKDVDENVRSRTCDILAKYDSEKSINALMEATNDRSKVVNWAARLALRELRVSGYDTAELDI